LNLHTFLPLSEVSFFILVSLVPEAKHGYAIWKDVEVQSTGALKISTSTLYDALERLLQQGLIERVEVENERSRGRPRKLYRINDLGKQVLIDETNRMRTLLDLATPHIEELLG
jgi:DNA-binding PadR family transcriptional regulator